LRGDEDGSGRFGHAPGRGGTQTNSGKGDQQSRGGGKGQPSAKANELFG